MDPWDAELVFARLSWGARAETPEQIARRLRETLALLQRLIPGRPVPVDHPSDLDDETRWTAFVRDRVIRADDGGPALESGYSPRVNLFADDFGVALSVLPSVGATLASESIPSNRVIVRFGEQTRPNPALPASSNVRPVAAEVVRGLVSIWQPDSAMLTGRSANKAQLKLDPPRGPTIGAVTWLWSRIFAVPDSVPGAQVEAYGEGKLLVVGSEEAPSITTESALAVRAELDRLEALVSPPVTQASPPEVPALDLLAPDTGSGEAQPEPAPVDTDEVLARVRGTQVALPPELQRLPDQPGWPEVIKDVHDSFDRLIPEEPFINMLADLARDAASLRDKLVNELYREATYHFEKATAGRYLQLYRGLVAVEGGSMPAELDQISPFRPMSEVGSVPGEVKDRVHATIAALIQHEVEGRFRT